MLVHQCDVCRQPIGSAERPAAVHITRDWQTFELCTLCAEPVMSILMGYELIPEAI
jgi:hypothetical protein